ncbi:plasmid replication protein RepC, partial [Cohaesibacter celericrescens]
MFLSQISPTLMQFLYREGGPMSSTHKTIARFRRLSDGIIASAVLAQQDNRPVIEKHELSLTLKRVAPCLGIKATAYHVLDILLGLVQADDFQEGRRPIVAISNQRLAEYTLHSTRTVTRCLKQLVEAGILAYKDSPTGRRYVNRDRTGRPIQAYGLDFTPACFNLSAFKNRADAFQQELNAQREAKRTVSRLARAILDLAEFDNKRFAELIDRARQISEDSETSWTTRASQMNAVYEDALYMAKTETKNVQKDFKMSVAGDISVATISNT